MQKDTVTCVHHTSRDMIQGSSDTVQLLKAMEHIHSDTVQLALIHIFS